MSYIVAQLGARMHYAVPRILHGSGQLEHFFTDICARKGWPRLISLLPDSLATASVRRVSGRVPRDVPGDRITAFNLLGLRYACQRRCARSPNDLMRTFLWAGRAFCRRVVSCGFGEADGIYVFNSAGLELLEAAKAHGHRTVLEQTIAPRRVESEILGVEQERFPSWQSTPVASRELEIFCEREEAEWRLADTILCGSPFVRDGIVRCRGPATRCVIVPYGVDGRFRQPPRPDRGSPLRVLVVGAVGLRKGSPYVLAAACALRGKAVFRLVGGIEALPPAAALLEDAAELIGSVSSSAMAAHFAWADVFLLPSLCEGSATAIYEALTASLPVICTPSSGSIVRDGIDGIVVPTCDSSAIVAALLRLEADPALRRYMAENARHRADAFDLAAYGRSLIAALDMSKAGMAP